MPRKVTSYATLYTEVEGREVMEVTDLYYDAELDCWSFAAGNRLQWLPRERVMLIVEAKQ